MKLFTKDQHVKLLRNGEHSAQTGESNVPPVVKLFTPWGGSTWLITEIDPENPTLAFGLCDLGQGYPELGFVDLEELEALKGPMGLKVERDRFFTPGNKTISQYQNEAFEAGRIVV